VGELSQWVAATGADLALTTQKDSVKLRIAALGRAPLRALRIGLEITDGLEALERILEPLSAVHEVVPRSTE
jgi:hypothetical protein